MESKTEQDPWADTAEDDTQADKEQIPIPDFTKDKDSNSVSGSLDTKQTDQVAGDENSFDKNEVLAKIDLPDGITADDSVIAAFEDYDEAETNPQAAEFWSCPAGDEFERNGRF